MDSLEFGKMTEREKLEEELEVKAKQRIQKEMRAMQNVIDAIAEIDAIAKRRVLNWALEVSLHDPLRDEAKLLGIDDDV